ncbi:MAG: hypothetical protein AAGA56_26430 [Myxococcota bacterium]
MTLRAIIIAAVIGGLGCAKNDGPSGPQPETAASLESYAVAYPDELEARSARIDRKVTEADEQTTRLSGFPDEIQEPTDWHRVKAVFSAADDSGRRATYDDAAAERDAIIEFIERDDGAVVKKMASGIQYAAKQQGCENMGGGATGTIKRALDEGLQEKMRAANEAHTLIARDEKAIGKSNAVKLRTQADTIAQLSHRVHVDLPRERYELERSKEVRATLERARKEAQKDADEAEGAAKKAADERVQAIDDSLARLDEQVKAAQANSQAIEKDVSRAKKDYEKALQGLQKAVAAKADQAGNDA